MSIPKTSPLLFAILLASSLHASILNENWFTPPQTYTEQFPLAKDALIENDTQIQEAASGCD